LFRSLKSEWIPKLGYLNLNEAKVDVGFYLMTHYNHDRPHAANNGLPPALAENTLK
jgi:putative transposase